MHLTLNQLNVGENLVQCYLQEVSSIEVDETEAHFCPSIFPGLTVYNWDDLEDEGQQLEWQNLAPKRAQLSDKHEDKILSLNDVSERDRNKCQSCFSCII